MIISGSIYFRTASLKLKLNTYLTYLYSQYDTGWSRKKSNTSASMSSTKKTFQRLAEHHQIPEGEDSKETSLEVPYKLRCRKGFYHSRHHHQKKYPPPSNTLRIRTYKHLLIQPILEYFCCYWDPFPRILLSQLQYSQGIQHS